MGRQIQLIKPVRLRVPTWLIQPSSNKILYHTTSSKKNDNDILKKPQSVKFIKDLPSEIEARRHQLSKWIEAKLDDLQGTVFTASRTLNDVTGYTFIQALKESIDVQAQRIKHLRHELQESKFLYTQSIQERAESQRRVNELLQRKHQWSASDLENFTKSFGDAHTHEKVVMQSQVKLEQTEKELEEAQAELTRTILIRYHEEQIWSDKIRKASTWGTFFLLAVNAVLFVVVQLGMEPWKRKRLTSLFEGKVEAALEEDCAQRTELKNENVTNKFNDLTTFEITNDENNEKILDLIPREYTSDMPELAPLVLPPMSSFKEIVDAFLKWDNYCYFFSHCMSFVHVWPVPSSFITSIGGLLGIFFGRIIHAYFYPM
ncbi:hypothetical protein NADFUDRAFT_84194 [Nadsonia fulvescens var. elongata DSM 6958]|uniref:Sensitive to high expression protein 9, mitochondrial n=1 Tax=Nadsonia fulvescens var. elongata DSM 6958 TaxID=857566 RepID=A0A1E3PDN7_9ASCO|nr:hypothetical protein NADFUDRAFT_84194 [Nadsonia fulvescens var. elongata DSM 6958]